MATHWLRSAGPADGADAVVRGRVDSEGHLVDADPVLAALHRRAGGVDGGTLAVPQIAALARTARRLGAPIARALIAADGEEDLDLWVRARPQDGGAVAIAITNWTRRPARPSLLRSGSGAGVALPDAAESDWSWSCDATLRLTALSHEGLRALDARPSDPVAGQPMSRVFQLEETEGGGLPLLDALAAGRAFDGQTVLVRRSGRRYRLAGAPVTDAGGRVRGFHGTAFALDAAQTPLAPVGDDAFAQRLDTALRAPLHRIVTVAEAIRAHEDGPLRTDYGGYASDIASAGRHLLGLVDDLADVEAVERVDLDMEREPLDLADLARRAAGLLAVRADDKRIAIDAPDETQALWAEGDFRRVLQVLVNLIGNAVRFAPEATRVRVAVEARAPGRVAVLVEDEGRGIPVESRERVFEKFERLGASEPGSGLGLYISRRLARAMHGDVQVEDPTTLGARVALILPAV